MAATSLVHTGNVQNIRKLLTWTAPAIAIPALRYTQDSHQQRKELFIRDASTYSIGALIFLATEFIGKKTLNRFNLIQNSGKRDLTAFSIALAANLLYAGIGAVRFSKAFSRYQSRKTTPQNSPESSTLKPPTSTNFLWNNAINWGSFPNTAMPFQPMQRIQYFA